MAYELTVPIQMPRLGYKYLTATEYGITVKMLDTANGLVRAREKSVPLLLFTIYKVDVKTAGNAEKIPPITGPPIWLAITARRTIDPARTPRPRCCRVV
jgi:hypothetical protein